MRGAAIVLMLGALAGGCLSTRAATPIERPALDVPPVPPRSVESPPLTAHTLPEPVPDLPPSTVETPTARPRPASARDVPAKETQKPELKPDADPVEAAAQPQSPPAAPVLRTPATADAVAAERQIRDTIARAQKALDGVNYQRLSDERKKAYDQAKDFIASAEATIKASNLELAKEYAEKAEKLARELQSR